MRTNKIVLLGMALTSISLHAFCNTFNAEINFSGIVSSNERGSEDGFYSFDAKESKNFSTTIYFNDVDTADTPLAESAFLQKISSLSIGHGVDEHHYQDFSEFFTMQTGENEYETVLYTRTNFSQTFNKSHINLDYFIPNSIFYLGAGLSKNVTDVRATDTYGELSYTGSWSYSHRTLWNAKLGITPTTGLLIWSEFFEDQELEDDWNIQTKYVTNWNSKVINIEVSYMKYYYHNVIGLATDLYLDNTFSIGATYNHGNGYADFGLDTYGVRSKKFFASNLAIEAAFTHSEKEEKYLIGATLRF